jgi:heat shock protein HslJ
MRRFVFVVVSGLLTACSPQSPKATNPADAETPVSQAIDAGKLWGNWRIVSISSTRVIDKDRSGKNIDLRLSFSPDGYSGSVGCNVFGGIGLLKGERYYTDPGGQTAMGCGELINQEIAVTRLMGLTGGPSLSFTSDDRLTLTNGGVSMVLERGATSETERTQFTAASAPRELVGTTWSLETIDNARAHDGRNAPTLSFEADYWSASLVCGTATSGWRQQGNVITQVGEISIARKACSPSDQKRDTQIIETLKANPTFKACCASGPWELPANLLMASDTHVLIARTGAPTVDQSALLAGNWLIASIDGAKPVADGTPPKLSFGATGYHGSTGCNAISGIFLAQNRFLFTLAGPQTEQGCSGPLGDQELRLNSLLAARPALAFLKSGGLALIDKDGRVVLERDAAQVGAHQSGPTKTLSSFPLRLESLAFDGQALPYKPTGPRPSLVFTARAWRASLGCQNPEGEWRMRDGVFSGFAKGVPYGAPPCTPDGTQWNERLDRMLDGQSRILIGSNGEFLLARHDHWMTGQVVRN